MNAQALSPPAPDPNWITNYPGHVLQWQGVCVIGTFVAFLAYTVFKHRAVDLKRIGPLITKSLAAIALPTGLLLAMSPFDDRAAKAALDSKVYLAFAGVVIIFLSLSEVTKKLEEPTA